MHGDAAPACDTLGVLGRRPGDNAARRPCGDAASCFLATFGAIGDAAPHVTEQPVGVPHMSEQPFVVC